MTLTRLRIRNFKRFGEDEVDIELSSPVVFIGPNNSGKTSALQALTLWNAGVKRWMEKRSGKPTPTKRPGVTVSRQDLVSAPTPEANLLWHDRHVRNVRREDGRQKTSNVLIEVTVDGVDDAGREWSCGMEFYYANSESFYCRPRELETGNGEGIPEGAENTTVALLPPMSGLAGTETRIPHGAISVRIGEGRTAEVLRNLCYQVHTDSPEAWEKLRDHIVKLFGVELEEPKYLPQRGEITMGYTERNVRLDLSSAGRGLQQTVLLLAYMFANPGTVIMLDEPDAHLEILRQRQIYNLIKESADQVGSQIIVASHSEVLLNEAAGSDLLVAFIGPNPHRIDRRESQVRKALADIGFEHYYQAEQTGWVLYLEGSTDLRVLRALARKLDHQGAIRALDRPYVHYVGNVPKQVSVHYFGLKESLPGLRAVALFDKLEQDHVDLGPVDSLMWKRREIENYIFSENSLMAWAERRGELTALGPLFEEQNVIDYRSAMSQSIQEVTGALDRLGRGSPWDANTKVSDEFLIPLFEGFLKSCLSPIQCPRGTSTN